MKKLSEFLSEIFHFLIVKFSVYLNRLVYVMLCKNIQETYDLDICQRGDSNKYPNNMFCEEIRIKQTLSYISFCFV